MSWRAFRRSFGDFKQHPWLHMISISTISVALIILGGFFLCDRNFENLAEKANPHMTGTLYLKDGLTTEQVDGVKARLLMLDHVHNVTFKPKAMVMQDLQSLLGGSGAEAVPGGELFPDVLELEADNDTTPMALSSLKAAVEKLPEIAETDFSEDWLTQYQKIRQVLRLFGFVLLTGILAGCSFIIANFMSMRHQSRKHEVDIVRLIGGNRGFVISPFLWEGLLEGLVGALIALIVLWVGRQLLATVISMQWNSLLGVSHWLFLSPGQLTGLFALGVLMALCGSVTVFIRFQDHNFR